jgi:hypothetical protein
MFLHLDNTRPQDRLVVLKGYVPAAI